MFTEQETFDKVWEYARKMTQPSTEGIACRYRFEDNGVVHRCLVGSLIPDEYYKPTMEGNSCEFGLVSEVLDKLGYDTKFLLMCQLAHDSGVTSLKEGRSSLKGWHQRMMYELRHIAKSWDLTIPEEKP